MLDKNAIGKVFAGCGGGNPPLCPDLTWWYAGCLDNNSMPPAFAGKSLLDIGRKVGVISSLPVKFVKIHYGSSSYTRQWTGDNQIITAQTPLGTIESRRTKAAIVTRLIKTPADLAILKELLRDISVSVDYNAVNAEIAAAPKDQILLARAPSNPISQIFDRWYDPVEGTFFMMDDPAQFDDLVSRFNNLYDPVLDALKEIDLQGNCFMFPDCIDSVFMPPPVFERYIAPYYARACGILKSAHTRNICIAHFDGVVKPLLPLVKHTGLDGVEAITTWPQNDLGLEEARSLLDQSIVMWGGIPSTALSKQGLPNEDDFDELAQKTVAFARQHKRVILGTADQVPPENGAIERLQKISRLLGNH